MTIGSVAVVVATLGLRSTLEESVASADAAIDRGAGDRILVVAPAECAERLSALPVEHLPSDCGLYAAWNLGVSRAETEWVVFLNDDDVLPAESLVEYRAALSSGPRPVAEMASGRATSVSDDPEARPFVVGPRRAASIQRWDASAIVAGPTWINARLLSRGLITRLGGFDESMRVAADLDFLAKVSRATVRNEVVDATTYVYREHATSLTMSSSRPGEIEATEVLQIARRHGLDGPAARSWRRRGRLVAASGMLGRQAPPPSTGWSSRDAALGLPELLIRAAHGRLVRRAGR